MLMPFFSPVVSVAISYLLRATGASKTAEDGTINYTETDGSIAASGGVYDVTAQSTPAWGDLGWVSDDVNAAASRIFQFTLNGSAIETTTLAAGWSSNGLALANMMSGIYVDGSGNIDLYSNGAAVFPDIGSVTNLQDEIFTIIKGGYDINGVPMDVAANIASYPYGASIYQKIGSNHILLGSIQDVLDTGQDFPAMSFGTYGGTYDLPIVPDINHAVLLEPIFLDTFTDDDSTALTSHTPDVDTEGGGWSVYGGITLEIQDNEAYRDGGTAHAGAIISTNVSDVRIKTTLPDAFKQNSGLRLRHTDENNYWIIITLNSNSYSLYEVNGGGFTLRGSAAITTGAGDRMVMIGKGTTITSYYNEASKLSYASANLNETATDHGIHLFIDTATMDNFVIHAYGTGGEYSDLENY